MAVATNWFDSHSFLCVFIFNIDVCEHFTHKCNTEITLLDSFGILLCNRHILIQKSQRIKE